MKYKSV
jgi:hypothetical protein